MNKVLSFLICGVFALSLNTSIAFADVNEEIYTTTIIEEENQQKEKNIEILNSPIEINETEDINKIPVEELETTAIEKETVIQEDDNETIIFILILVVAILASLGCYRTILLEKEIKGLENSNKVENE